MKIPPVSASSESGMNNYENQIEQLETEKRIHKSEISDEQLSADETDSKEQKIEQLEKQMKLIEVQIQQMKAHEMMQKFQNRNGNNIEDENTTESKSPTEEKYASIQKKDPKNNINVKI